MSLGLNVDRLTVGYGTGRNGLTAVDDVSLSIPVGETLGLVGESGSGKSTLGRAIVGITPIASGTVNVDGVCIGSAAGYQRVRGERAVQMVFQNPQSSLNPRMTIGTALKEAQSVDSQEHEGDAQERAIASLQLVGLDESAMDRYPHQFSGGQRQRIAIARSLATNPRFIVLDEVTSSLDVSVQATILNLLLDLQRRLNLTYLFISHNLAVVRHVSDSIAVMYLGRILEQGEASILFSRPRHPYTRSLIDSLPRLESSDRETRLKVVGEIPDPRNPPSGCRFRTRCPIGPIQFPERVVCVEVDPQPASVPASGQFAACHYPLDNGRRS